MRPERKKISFIGLGTGSLALPLYKHISEHPEVCLPKAPLNFFSDVKVYAQGLDWYESNFVKLDEGQKVGELAFYYLENLQGAGLIARTYPSAKLFAVIENPLVAVKMAYLEARRFGRIELDCSIEQFIEQRPQVLQKYLFGKQLAQYLSYYSLKDLLVVTSFDVLSTPVEMIASVFEHIGVKSNFVPPALIHLIPEEEEDPKHRPGIIKRTFRFFAKIIKGTYKKILVKIKPVEVSPDAIILKAQGMLLSPELENYLKDYYRRDVTILSSLLHRNLVDEWGF